MKKALMAILAAVAYGAAALPATAQTCPQGQHYDKAQQKCVPHGG